MSGLFGQTAAAPTSTIGDLKMDVAIANPPEDSISDLAFNPNPSDPKDFLAVASWDKKVRIYEVLGNGTAEGKHLYEHDAPVFSCDYYKVMLSLLPCVAASLRFLAAQPITKATQVQC